MSNLPAQSTPLIGRTQELLQMRTLLRRPDVRHVTLIGPGGIGKTRLGLQVAQDLVAEFGDDVFFVPLAALADPDLVSSAIAHTLGVEELADHSIVDSLKGYLRGRRLLLVLDNFEQVLEAATMLAELLAAAPQMKALVTSRVALHIYGEREYPVPPLALPDRDQEAAMGRNPESYLCQYDAARLFIDRARAIKPDFQVTDLNAQPIVEICHRLDGLPLAIELAAARCKLLPPHLLLERLKSRLKLLTGGARDLPERQRTLRGAIDWSYDLLAQAEKELFSRLAVFAGGWSFEAVEQAVDAGHDLEIDILDGLQSLVDKSLIRQEEVTLSHGHTHAQASTTGEPRFFMLETIREYALERLDASGQLEVLKAQHARYYLAIAELAEGQLTGPRQAEWLQRLDLEHDNLRAALHWALERGEAETAVRLGAALWRFWQMHGYAETGRQWLESALAGSRNLPAPLREQALIGAAVLAERQGDYGRANQLFEENGRLARELDDKQGLAFVLNGLGNIAMNQRDFARAQPLYEESLALRRQLGDDEGILQSLNNLGWNALEQGDYDRAASFLKESYQLGLVQGDQSRVARSLHYQGMLACEQGNLSAAGTLYEQSLKLRQELGDKWGIAESLEALAGLAALQGQPNRAFQLAGAAEKLREAIGAPLFDVGRVRLERWLARARDDLGDAVASAERKEGRAMTLQQVLVPGEPAPVEEIQIQIDADKKAKQVATITESDYFQTLQRRARDLRKRPT